VRLIAVTSLILVGIRPLTGDHWPCKWEIKPGSVPGTYRILTLGHHKGGQAPGWGLSAWHAHGAMRNAESSWAAVRFLTTHHDAGSQPASWGLSAWQAHGGKRDDASSRVAVHSGEQWPMDWVLRACV
jgi:hypothetical protein